MVGTTFRAKRNRWQVNIRIRKADRAKFGNFKFIGLFETKKEAENAYDNFIIDNNLHLHGYQTNRNLAVPDELY